MGKCPVLPAVTSKGVVGSLSVRMAVGRVGQCRTGVGTHEIWGGAPTACGRVEALGGVVAKLLTVGATGRETEAQFAFGAEGAREGTEAAARGNRLGPQSGNQDHNIERFLVLPLVK